ncbi:riboflavin synthase [Anoxynatronum sibiricum]|uniref:Riboflavin synthase n=1 Tax=Anoxynatronum sibiricum TaxID=210623 RepID=A0ABU9VPV2_9CLOT
MFTGIIEEIGVIESIHHQGGQAMQLVIHSRQVLEDVRLGDSIAVNGICLTVTRFTPQSFQADVMPETFRSTSLAGLKSGSRVNLERALQANGRFGGHIVSGHIDGAGTLIRNSREANALWLEIEATDAIMKYIVLKGSVALDGTSLTVSKVWDKRFAVSIIPHTAEMTILAEKQTGDRVNIECDVLAKYVEKLMNGGRQAVNETGKITTAWLQEHGY